VRPRVVRIDRPGELAKGAVGVLVAAAILVVEEREA
jgi:hypothetical protein